MQRFPQIYIPFVSVADQGFILHNETSYVAVSVDIVGPTTNIHYMSKNDHQ